MQLVETVGLSYTQRFAIMELWNKEYPEQICYKTLADFDSYLAGLNDKSHYLLMDEQDSIKGWGLLFERAGESWFAIILHSSAQHKGYGTIMLDALKSKAEHLAGWVTDHNNYTTASGAVYSSPLKFYLKNGFSICPDIRLETGKLSAVKVVWSR